MLYIISSMLYAQNKDIEIANLIHYSVMIKDTTTLKSASIKNTGETPIHDYINDHGSDFISLHEFKDFTYIISKFVNDKNAIAFYGDKKIPATQLKERITQCDSIQETFIDNLGHEITVSRWICDSLSIIKSIVRIDFYERWSIDPKTYELKKEVLAYVPMTYIPARKIFKRVFTVYKNEDAWVKIGKYTQ